MLLAAGQLPSRLWAFGSGLGGSRESQRPALSSPALGPASVPGSLQVCQVPSDYKWPQRLDTVRSAPLGLNSVLRLTPRLLLWGFFSYRHTIPRHMGRRSSRPVSKRLMNQADVPRTPSRITKAPRRYALESHGWSGEEVRLLEPMRPLWPAGPPADT